MAATSRIDVTEDWTLLATGVTSVSIQLLSEAKAMEIAVADTTPTENNIGHVITGSSPLASFNDLDDTTNDVYARCLSGSGVVAVTK